MTGKSDEESIPAKNNNTEADYSDLYPGRKNDSSSQSWMKKIPFYKSENFDKIKCETNVYSCLKESEVFIFISSNVIPLCYFYVYIVIFIYDSIFSTETIKKFNLFQVL